MSYPKLRVAFVEGSRKSVCRNSGWFISDHSNGIENAHSVRFVPIEEGRKGLATALREVRHDLRNNRQP